MVMTAILEKYEENNYYWLGWYDVCTIRVLINMSAGFDQVLHLTQLAARFELFSSDLYSVDSV